MNSASKPFALLAALLLAACPGSIDPEERRDQGPKDSQPSDTETPADQRTPDRGAREAGVDAPSPDSQRPDTQPPKPDIGPDGPQLTFCAHQPDATTLALFPFEVRQGGGQFLDVTTAGYQATSHGTVQHGGSGKPGCTKAALFDGQGGYLQIPHDSSFSLIRGSVDLWVRFDNSATAGIVSKDALGTNETGHITVQRICDGSIAVRKQETNNQSFVQCSAPIPNGTWVHVGVNFGTGGLELWVDGVKSSRKGTVSCNGWVCGSSTESGIAGNTNPWVLGGDSMRSGDGKATPVEHPLRGAIDSFRVSSARRNF